MTQEITVTKVEDHYEMQFDGGNAYPVPTNAIDKLDDDLTPEEVGESVTFLGDYGGHKHCKNFDVEEVLDGLDDVDDETKGETSEETDSSETEEIITDEDDEFAEPSVGEAGKCLHAKCDVDADVAVKCDTGQIKHYCDEHHDGRRAGHARVVESKRLRSDEDTGGEDSDGSGNDVCNVAEPTPEHVEEVGYHKAAGQAQQIEAQRLFAGTGGSE